MDKKQKIKEMIERAKLLQAGTCNRVTAHFQKMLASLEDSELLTRSKDLEKRAYSGDRVAMQQLNAFRVINISNFLMPASNAMAFFETERLEEADTPMIENDTRQEIRVRFVGGDGGLQMTQFIKEKAYEHIPLRWIASDIVEYPLVDINKGVVADSAKAQVDIAFDMAMKIDKELWKLVKSLVGNFVLTGPKNKRTYVPHSSVNAANLPTTNLINLSTNGANTKFRLDAIKAALAYCAQWGNNTFSDGDLAPETFYIPSKHVSDFLDEVSASSTDNEITRQIFSSGYVLNLAGKTFNIVGDSTLDPAEKMAYVRTNKPIGYVFEKPSLDEVIPRNGELTFDEQHQNKGRMAVRKPFAAASPTPKAVNLLGVKFATT